MTISSISVKLTWTLHGAREFGYTEVSALHLETMSDPEAFLSSSEMDEMARWLFEV